MRTMDGVEMPKCDFEGEIFEVAKRGFCSIQKICKF
jgi:hypothetical protein